MENKTGICLQPFIPLRLAASERSEMITQILFGEMFIIKEHQKESGFSYIINENDKYEGWVDEKTIKYITQKEQESILSYPAKIVSTREYRVVDTYKNEMWLSAGSILRIKPGNNIYGTLSMYTPGLNEYSPREIFEQAAGEWVNVAYIWGGKTTFGTDCSGMVQNIYKQAGINIPRDSQQQAEMGKNVNFIFESQPGDLAFFNNEEGIITHVGMILSGNRILHASGKVRIDLFDQQGIYSREKGNYTHKLRLMRNLVDG
ncbi:MAG: NlpC/P60 family protein [Bacteroidota bacterium]